jgi:hypothetical protein
MAFYLKKKYNLPFDICRYINRLNDKELIEYTKFNKEKLHIELLDYVYNLQNYIIHEYYFVSLLYFLRNVKPFIPKFNDYNEIYNISLRENNITHSQFILYRDHMNNFIYQKNFYQIYYNLL